LLFNHATVAIHSTNVGPDLFWGTGEFGDEIGAVLSLGIESGSDFVTFCL